MLRSSILSLLLLLPGCAVVDGDTLLAAMDETEAAAELECMTRCLSESDGTCEACADHCMDRDTQVVEITALRARNSSR